MREIVRRVLPVLAAIMLLAGQIEHVAAGIAVNSGSHGEASVSRARTQKNPGMPQAASDEIDEIAGGVEEMPEETPDQSDRSFGNDDSGTVSEAVSGEEMNEAAGPSEDRDSDKGSAHSDKKGSDKKSSEKKGSDEKGSDKEDSDHGSGLDADGFDIDDSSMNGSGADGSDSVSDDAIEGDGKKSRRPSEEEESVREEEVSDGILIEELPGGAVQDEAAGTEDAADLIEEACEEEEQVVTAQVSAVLGGDEEAAITLTGAMPAGAEVVASDAALQAEEAGLRHVLCAYDITINDGWQPQEALEVSIARWNLTEGVRVYHIGGDGVPQEVEVSRSQDGEVAFLAEGFSIYAVTDDLARRTYEFMDYKFGAWIPYEFSLSLPEDPEDPNQGSVTTSRQILRNGDSLVVPSMPDKDGMRFLGWYASPSADVTQTPPERGGVKKDITTDSIVTLYARYGWPAVITYYARPEGASGNQVFNTQIVFLPSQGAQVRADLSEQIHPEAPAEGQDFLGWVKAGGGEMVDEAGFALSGDVSLYPVFAVSYEIAFLQEEGEEYHSPVYVGEEGISGRLSDKMPQREGYLFEGWAVGEVQITDQDGKILEGDVDFDGGTLSGGLLFLDEDIVVRGLWKPMQTQYRVVFWQEKASDEKKLAYSDSDDGGSGSIGAVGTGGWHVPKEQREYEFLGSIGVEADAGATVSAATILEGYSGLSGVTGYPTAQGQADFTGLAFCELRDAYGNPFEGLEVTGDGTSTVHVYYDREVVTIRFHYPDDVRAQMAVEEPTFYPELPASGTVTQKAVTSVRSVDYPEDSYLIGLYGGMIADARTDTGAAPSWPVSYTVKNASYTVQTRTMQYSGGRWQQMSSSSADQTAASLVLSTRWLQEDGRIAGYRETFSGSMVVVPSQTLTNLSLSGSGTVSQVACYKETEQAAYPASAVYSSTPALTFDALEGETAVVSNPFDGYELDYFTYTDSKGTPIRREADASLAQRTLVGGTFSSLKIYCRRKVHHIYYHNGMQEAPVEGPGVKYGMGLATDYVKQSITDPALPEELAGQSDLEFSGWYLDSECTIYLDTVGLKAAGRANLMLKYGWIQSIVSLYDYRPAGGTAVPAMRMTDADIHLFAGWTPRRALVRLEPDGGELPEDVPTFFWENCGEILGVLPVSRDYVPAGQGLDGDGNLYAYHIHTYEQSQKDNNVSDRTACYVPEAQAAGGSAASEGAVRYVRAPGGYRFLGWFLVEEGADGREILRPYDSESHLKGDIRLRAQWSRLGAYSVEYDPGDHGRLSGSIKNAVYRDHASIALRGDVLSDTGYAFTGWRIRRPDGSGELLDGLYSSGDELAIDADDAQIVMDEYTGEPRGVITLVAQYEPVRGTSITYYVNGGVFVGPTEEDMAADPSLARELGEKLTRNYGASAAHHYIYGDDGAIIGYTVSGIEQNANLTTEDGTWFQRSGYKLMGWSSAPAGEVELALHAGGFNAASDPEGAGHVLYAIWKPERQVVYNLQGGTWNAANGSKYRQEDGNWIYGAGNGEQAPVPLSPSKAGYAFAGWNQSSTAKEGMQAMPKATKNITLYAVWVEGVVLRFETGGGGWESLAGGLYLLAPNCYGMIVDAGSSAALPADSPVREGGFLFHKWEHGSYQYAPGGTFRTSAEQAGQTLVLTAVWSEGVPAVEVLVGADDSVSIVEEESLVGAAEGVSEPAAPREIEGYQYLFTVYDEEPESVEDIVEHYRVTGIQRLGENIYQVKLANGQTKTHYAESAEKLQAVYIQDRKVDVLLKRMNIFEDGLDVMNLKLSALQDGPYKTLQVGRVDIQDALPAPKKYVKIGANEYKSFTYAIGRRNAQSMYEIDTMTQTKLWIRQTLKGFAFSVNGEEWKDLDREEGAGKDVGVYIIYDNRVETPTTINHTVYGLKSDKEKLFTYDVYVRGRWGFNIGSGAYFLHKPDDPSEELNSYTIALHDNENVLIPLHIDYIYGQNQAYSPGDLFYDMFGGDYPTKSSGSSQLRIWQEVEMVRTDELPFTGGEFETSIKMTCTSNSNYHNIFNGYDKVNHRWLKQLGISKIYYNAFEHSFIYTRTSLDVPVHVLELTRDGYELRDEEWLRGGEASVSVRAGALTVGDALASELTEVPSEYALQGVRYGLSRDALSGTDRELNLRLAAERNDATLFHVYDYGRAADAADAASRALVPDGAAIYLVYGRHSSARVPVEYVRQDSSGAYTPVDLSGSGISAPVITVTDSEEVDFRSLPEVLEANEAVRKLDAYYLTGRMLLADRKGAALSTYQPGEYGDWDSGRPLKLVSTETGLVYTADDGTRQIQENAKVWIEVSANAPLRIVGRLWQRGSFETNTGVIPYLPKDGEGRVTAIPEADAGGFSAVGEDFTGFQEYIPYAADPEMDYLRASMGGNGAVFSVAYCSDENGYRHWLYREKEGSKPVRVDEILYADYSSTWSPVNVRYVVPANVGGYVEVEDLEEEVLSAVASRIRVDRSGVVLADAIGESLDVIDQGSALYRTAGTFVLGSAALEFVYFTADHARIRLTDGVDGLTYQSLDESGAPEQGGSGTLKGGSYPDIYVVLRPIATLTVSKRIDDAGGYARWDDAFDITVRISGGDVELDGDYPAALSSDDSLDNAVPADPDGLRTVTFAGGEARISLCHGQSVAIPGLPRGIRVIVVEDQRSVYSPSYRIVQGARVVSGNDFILNRHSTVEVVNTSIDITKTGKDFADRPAYALLFLGAALYAAYLLLRRRRPRA